MHRRLIMFTVWFILMLLALLAGTGCQYLEISDIIMTNDIHADCKESHYIDPYTKLEYCLPDDITTIGNINSFRVE